MTITIAPLTVNPSCDCKPSPVRCEQDEHIKRNHMPINYWGFSLSDKHISYTSSNELAEKTKFMDREMIKGQALKVERRRKK